MGSLKAHSSLWRATCSYSTHSIVLTAYVRGNFKDINIVASTGSGVCKKMDFVNIRGHRMDIHQVKRWQFIFQFVCLGQNIQPFMISFDDLVGWIIDLFLVSKSEHIFMTSLGDEQTDA